jgi:protein-tyrosine-phosphatase
MPAILFVCTGNLCRSPMAAVLLRKMLAGRGEEGGWVVESAGTWTIEGEPSPSGAAIVLVERGLDLSAHRSRRVSGELLGRFDLILTMESRHEEALKVEFPHLADRIFMLTDMIGERWDIPDPLGGSIIDYRAAAQVLSSLLEQGFEEIIQRAKYYAASNELIDA